MQLKSTVICLPSKAGSPFSISAPLHWRSTLTEQRRQTSSTGAAYLLSPDSPPLYFTQQCLETIHAFSHAPWWVVILGGTAVLRALVTLPLAVHQNKLVAKIELLQPTVKMMTESLRHRVTIECRRAGMSAEEAEKRFKKQVLRLRARERARVRHVRSDHQRVRVLCHQHVRKNLLKAAVTLELKKRAKQTESVYIARTAVTWKLTELSCNRGSSYLFV